MLLVCVLLKRTNLFLYNLLLIYQSNLILVLSAKVSENGQNIIADQILFRNPPKIIQQEQTATLLVLHLLPEEHLLKIATLFKVATSDKCARFNTFPLYYSDICWDNI